MAIKAPLQKRNTPKKILLVHFHFIKIERFQGKKQKKVNGTEQQFSTLNRHEKNVSETFITKTLRWQSAGLSTPFLVLPNSLLSMVHILGKMAEIWEWRALRWLRQTEAFTCSLRYFSVGLNLESVLKKCWIVKTLKWNRTFHLVPFHSIQTAQMFPNLLGISGGTIWSAMPPSCPALEKPDPDVLLQTWPYGRALKCTPESAWGSSNWHSSSNHPNLVEY